MLRILQRQSKGKVIVNTKKGNIDDVEPRTLITEIVHMNLLSAQLT